MGSGEESALRMAGATRARAGGHRLEARLLPGHAVVPCQEIRTAGWPNMTPWVSLNPETPWDRVAHPVLLDRNSHLKLATARKENASSLALIVPRLEDGNRTRGQTRRELFASVRAGDAPNHPAQSAHPCGTGVIIYTYVALLCLEPGERRVDARASRPASGPMACKGQ
jgi:hypothetical protein